MDGQKPIDQPEYYQQQAMKADAKLRAGGLPAQIIAPWPNPLLFVRVPGEPRGNPRKVTSKIIKGGRVVGTQTHQDPNAVIWKATFQQYFETAMKAIGLQDQPLHGLCAIHIIAWKMCPRSTWLKNKERPEIFSDQRPDTDNVTKLVKDAGEGVLYLDDKQVAIDQCVKLRAKQGEPARVEIRFYELPESPSWMASAGVVTPMEEKP